jgi:anti-sigma B factor antagonist
MSDVGDFAVSIRRTPTEVIVAVDGEVDLSTASLLREALGSIDEVDVAIDAAGLSFIDSSGLSVLVGAAKRLASAGHTLAVRNAPKSIRRVLEITSLDTIVRVETPELAGGGLLGSPP